MFGIERLKDSVLKIEDKIASLSNQIASLEFYVTGNSNRGWGRNENNLKNVAKQIQEKLMRLESYLNIYEVSDPSKTYYKKIKKCRKKN